MLFNTLVRFELILIIYLGQVMVIIRETITFIGKPFY